MAYTHVCTTIDQLNTIPVINEQVIFVTDTQQIYLDYNNIRNNVTIGEITPYSGLIDKYTFSAQTIYYIGDLCYYINGWYLRIGGNGQSGLWNDDDWKEIVVIEDTPSDSSYSFGDNLNFGNNSVAVGAGNFLFDSSNSLIGGAVNILNGNDNNISNTFIFGQGNNIQWDITSVGVIGSFNEIKNIEGIESDASSICSNCFIEGSQNLIQRFARNIHIEGYQNNIANGLNSHIEGQGNSIATYNLASSEMIDGDEFPKNVHIEGSNNSLISSCDDENIHIEGKNNIINSQHNRDNLYGEINNVHIEGQNNTIISQDIDSLVVNEAQYIDNDASNIHILGNDNTLNIGGALENILLFGSHQNINHNIVRAGTPSMQGSLKNISLFGERLEGSNNDAMIVGKYNDKYFSDDVLFAVGNGQNDDFRDNAVSVAEDKLRVNVPVMFGQYEFLPPIEKIISFFASSNKRIDTKLRLVWGETLSGILLKELNLNSLNETLDGNIRWFSPMGTQVPWLYFVIYIPNKIEIEIRCQWINSDHSYDLDHCEYRYSLAEFIFGTWRWTLPTEWTEASSNVQLQYESSIIYTPIYDITVSMNSENSFALYLGLDENTDQHIMSRSYVRFSINVDRVSLSYEDLTNEDTKWSVGSSDFKIVWYDEKDVPSIEDYKNWAFNKQIFCQNFLSPTPHVPYGIDALVFYHGVLYYNLTQDYELPTEEEARQQGTSLDEILSNDWGVLI